MLSEAIKGKSELHDLLNKNINKTNTDPKENKIFRKIAFNISLFHSEHKKIDINDKDTVFENKNYANTFIYINAEEGILERISNMSTEDIDKFKEEFEKIKLDQRKIKYITEKVILDYNKEQKERLIKSTEGKYEMVDTKLRCIDEILRNDEIKDKIDLVQHLKNTKSLDEIMLFIKDNQINIDFSGSINISPETVKKYNLEYTSNNAKWDNMENIEYIKKHKKQIIRFANLKKAAIKILKLIENGDSVLGSKENTQIKMIPENTQTINQQEHSWDLSNWGIDKQQFMEDSKKNIQNYKEREEKRTEELTADNSYERI